MVQVIAALTSFSVSMDIVWTQPRPVMAYLMTALITVMRATAHVSDSLWGQGEGHHRIEGRGIIG